MRKKKSQHRVDPTYPRRQREALRRKNRQVVYFNDKEMEAIHNYCERFGIRRRSTLYREAIISLILSELEKNHPTLF